VIAMMKLRPVDLSVVMSLHLVPASLQHKLMTMLPYNYFQTYETGTEAMSPSMAKLVIPETGIQRTALS